MISFGVLSLHGNNSNCMQKPTRRSLEFTHKYYPGTTICTRTYQQHNKKNSDSCKVKRRWIMSPLFWLITALTIYRAYRRGINQALGLWRTSEDSCAAALLLAVNSHHGTVHQPVIDTCMLPLSLRRAFGAQLSQSLYYNQQWLQITANQPMYACGQTAQEKLAALDGSFCDWTYCIYCVYV